MLFDAFLHAKSEAGQPWTFCQTKFEKQDRRLSDDYASLIFKYCDQHPDLLKIVSEISLKIKI